MPADNFKHKRSPFGGKSTNILNDSAYDANAERQNGFQKSTPIHSDVVNTALKQASFVTCAVLDGLKNNAASDFNATIDSTTEYRNVASAIQTLLSKQRVEQAGNVSKTINGHEITSIFEDDGVTAKKATRDVAGKNIAETYATKENPQFTGNVSLNYNNGYGAMKISIDNNPTGVGNSFKLVGFYNQSREGATSPLYLSREGSTVGNYCNPIFQTGDYVVEKQLVLKPFRIMVSELKKKPSSFFKNVIKMTEDDGDTEVYRYYDASDGGYTFNVLRISDDYLTFGEKQDSTYVLVWKLVRKSDNNEVEAVS